MKNFKILFLITFLAVAAPSFAEEPTEYPANRLTSMIASSMQRDEILRKKIVGTWTEEGINGSSTFFENGRYTADINYEVDQKKMSVHIDGIWWITGGKLYNQISFIEPADFPFPNQKEPIIDIIVDINSSAMTLIDDKGEQYTQTRVN
jgi:hypothetical protein